MMYDIGMKHLLIQRVFFVRHMFFYDVDVDVEMEEKYLSLRPNVQ